MEVHPRLAAGTGPLSLIPSCTGGEITPKRTIVTDYLVVGCGAAGMAFADSLIAASRAEIVMVDRRHAPGGHWLEAYPFVRLHQPSSFYGVNSLPLGSETIDRHGPNEGFYERAGAAEICGYYDRVMRERLLPSGRVARPRRCSINFSSALGVAMPCLNFFWNACSDALPHTGRPTKAGMRSLPSRNLPILSWGGRNRKLSFLVYRVNRRVRSQRKHANAVATIFNDDDGAVRELHRTIGEDASESLDDVRGATRAQAE